MSTQEKELIKTEKESRSSGSCSTSDAKALLPKPKNSKNLSSKKCTAKRVAAAAAANKMQIR